MATFKLFHTHCSECGTPFKDTINWPRECRACEAVKFNNPIPVAIVLQPVEMEMENGSFSTGLAVARRAIEPGRGKWALIGGFMENTDPSAEDAAIREFGEETALKVASRPRVVYTKTTVTGQLLCICVIDKPLSVEEYNKGQCCPENMELDILWEPKGKDIAFPFHQEAIDRWFNHEFYNEFYEDEEIG